MKQCPTCGKVVENKKTTYCSTSCASIARRGSSGKDGKIAEGRVLPEWGACYLLDGEFFKIGHLNKVYRWGITEWMTTSRTVAEVRGGQFGRFWGGRFKAEVRA